MLEKDLAEQNMSLEENIKIALQYAQKSILVNTEGVSREKLDDEAYVFYKGDSYEREQNGFVMSWKKLNSSLNSLNIHFLFWNPKEYRKYQNQIKEWINMNSPDSHRIIDRPNGGVWYDLALPENIFS